MTTEQEMKNLLYEVDWAQVHELYALGDWGTDIYILPDGSIETLQRSQVPGFDYLGCIEVGSGNIDSTLYSQGWSEAIGGDLYKTGDGRVLSYEEMIAQSIRDGQWVDTYNDWQEEILRQWREQVVA